MGSRQERRSYFCVSVDWQKQTYKIGFKDILDTQTIHFDRIRFFWLCILDFLFVICAYRIKPYPCLVDTNQLKVC